MVHLLIIFGPNFFQDEKSLMKDYLPKWTPEINILNYTLIDPRSCRIRKFVLQKKNYSTTDPKLRKRLFEFLMRRWDFWLSTEIDLRYLKRNLMHLKIYFFVSYFSRRVQIYEGGNKLNLKCMWKLVDLNFFLKNVFKIKIWLIGSKGRISDVLINLNFFRILYLNHHQVDFLLHKVQFVRGFLWEKRKKVE